MQVKKKDEAVSMGAVVHSIAPNVAEGAQRSYSANAGRRASLLLKLL